MRKNQCRDPNEVILPLYRVKGLPPITTIIVGEYHDSIQAPLLLKHLHPHISHIFQCHLVEREDNFSEIEYIKYRQSLHQSILNAYEAIRMGLLNLNDTNSSTRRFRSFEKMIRYPFEQELREVIAFLNLSIPGTTIYRMSRIKNIREDLKLINISKQLNFSIAGIDNSHVRERTEACLMSHNTTCLRDLLDLLESSREQTMLSHLTRYHGSGKNCTVILGDTHVKNFMSARNSDQDSWMILRPFNCISVYDLARLPCTQSALRLVTGVHQQHVYAYSIGTEEEAERAAIAIAKYINASHNLFSSEENLCFRSFISEHIDLQQVFMNSVFHGAIHGMANLAKYTAKQKKKAHPAFKAQCMVYLIGYLLFSYYENRQKATSNDNAINTVITTVFDAIIMTMINIFMLCVSCCLDYTKEKINKNGWKNTGQALQLISEYGKYAFFAINVEQQGIEAAATAIAIGCATQNVIEYAGKAILDRVIAK